MKPIPQQANILELRAFLDLQGYNSDALTRRLGRAFPPAEGEERQMFDDSSEITAVNVLIRLFLLGAPVDEASLREFLPESMVRFCLSAGLIELEDGMGHGGVVIIPVEDLLFMSDAFRMLGTDQASEFVLPASTHSANFLRLLTMRAPVDTTLDLGCGCGIQALFAARHSKTVVATDVSESALWYTAVNALLNGIDNVECEKGSLFEPVEGRRFDLIVSNPPFVISPSEAFVYRDSALDLDEFCSLLVRESPRYLNDGGHLQMLCEWAEIAGQPWQDRIGGWIRGCDAWVLHAAPVPPAAYVKQRSSDIAGDSVNAGPVDEWMAYFEKHSVVAVHPGMLALRRRAGANWMHVQNITGDVTRPAGDAVADGIDAVDFLESCDEESLLDATLTLAETLVAERMEEDGNTSGIYLKLDNALKVDAEIDGAVAAFLNLFNGQRTVRLCVAEFGATTEADMDALTSDLLSILRVFVSRGFLVPAELE